MKKAHPVKRNNLQNKIQLIYIKIVTTKAGRLEKVSVFSQKQAKSGR